MSLAASQFSICARSSCLDRTGCYRSSSAGALNSFVRLTRLPLPLSSALSQSSTLPDPGELMAE